MSEETQKLQNIVDSVFKSGQREAIIRINEAIVRINKDGGNFHEKLKKFTDNYFNNLVSFNDAKTIRL